MKKIQEDTLKTPLEVKDKYRDSVDLLRTRLSMLTGQDKLLMKMYWENGNTFGQISRLAGINRSSITRRINKLTKRLMEGQYIDCLRNRDRFTEQEMDIAEDYFLRGISMKNITVKRHLSYYQVRRSLERIQRILAAIRSESSESKNNRL